MVSKQGSTEKLARKLDWEKSIIDTLGDADKCVRCYKEVASTMSVARELAVPDKAVIILAENQTAGVGRRGQPWETTPGSLFATIGFKVDKDQDCSLMPLAAGVAILKVLDIAPGELYLKWPNDIYTPSGRKIGGILIEKYKKILAIGIGLNLQAAPKDLGADSVSSAVGRTCSPPELISHLFPLLQSMLYNSQKAELLDILNEWKVYSYSYGTEMTGIVDGKEIIGRYQGVDETGRIKIEQEVSGMKIISTFSTFEIKSLKLG